MFAQASIDIHIIRTDSIDSMYFQVTIRVQREDILLVFVRKYRATGVSPLAKTVLLDFLQLSASVSLNAKNIQRGVHGCRGLGEAWLVGPAPHGLMNYGSTTLISR
jgi:hypothetical protein